MKQFWQKLSKRERGLVFISAAILLVFVARFVVVSPYLARRERVKAQLESQPQLLQKNLRYLSQKEALNAGLETAQSQIKAIEPKLLTGDTPSVSASDLQETVQGLATREGTQLITTRVLNTEAMGNFSKIAIQMEIGGQIQQLANLISGIENSPKLLVIDEINVRSLFRPVGFPAVPGAAAPQVQQNLRISLTVAGFSRTAPRGAAKSDPNAKPAKPAI